MTHLLQCPFCGGEPIMEPWHGGGVRKKRVSCDNEECFVQSGVTGANIKVAASRWNTRLNNSTGIVETAVFDVAQASGGTENG